jgi:predicted DNA-binding transcriptional regulator
MKMQQELVISTLKEFGLNDNEIAVYFAALKEPEVTPFKLARITKIPRTTVYDALYSLSLKGLVQIIQPTALEKQQTRIKAKNPSVIRQQVRERQAKLLELEARVLDILPTLKQGFQQEQANAHFRFHPGIEGAKKVMTLDSSGVDLPHHVLTNLTPMDAVGKEFTNNDVDAELEFRASAKNKIKEIIPLNDWTKHVVSYQLQRNPKYLQARELRYLDKPGFQFQVNQTLRGDGRVSFYSLQGDESWGFEVYSNSLYASLLSQYQLLWELATPLTEKEVKSWGKNTFGEKLQSWLAMKR